jgi:hypothetical protein
MPSWRQPEVAAAAAATSVLPLCLLLFYSTTFVFRFIRLLMVQTALLKQNLKPLCKFLKPNILTLPPSAAAAAFAEWSGSDGKATVAALIGELCEAGVVT